MTRKICCLGDSITWTATTRSIHPYPLYLEMLLGPGYAVGNQAISGYIMSQIDTLYTSYVQGKGYNDVIILGGINDLRVGTTNATIYPIWKGIVDDCLADGCRVIGFNTLQMNNYGAAWTQGKEDERTLYNAAISSYLTGRASCTFVDASSQFADSGTPTRIAAALQAGDDLHPNQAGTYLLAQLAQAAVLATG